MTKVRTLQYLGTTAFQRAIGPNIKSSVPQCQKYTASLEFSCAHAAITKSIVAKPLLYASGRQAVLLKTTTILQAAVFAVAHTSLDVRPSHTYCRVHCAESQQNLIGGL